MARMDILSENVQVLFWDSVPCDKDVEAQLVSLRAGSRATPLGVGVGGRGRRVGSHVRGNARRNPSCTSPPDSFVTCLSSLIRHFG